MNEGLRYPPTPLWTSSLGCTTSSRSRSKIYKKTREPIPDTWLFIVGNIFQFSRPEVHLPRKRLRLRLRWLIE